MCWQYAIILRDPLDRTISSHFYSYITNDHHSFANWTALHLPFTNCDDHKVLTQYLAGPASCDDPITTHETMWNFVEDRKTCNCSAQTLELTKERLDSFYLVIILDWFHLSGDLLCARLGWCDERFLAENERPSPNCGGRVTLEVSPPT